MKTALPATTETAQEETTLEGEALKFYEGVTDNEDYYNGYYHNDLELSAYNRLIELGYVYELHSHLFESEEPIDIDLVSRYNISPEMATYAKDYLVLGEEDYLEHPSWLGEAIALADISKAVELEKRGWDVNLAIIIAAFPERKAHLMEISDHHLEHQPYYVYSDYDVDMLARLHKIAGSHSEMIVELLDLGYSEKEITDYGIHLTRYFTQEELRGSITNPTALKNIFTVFKNEAFYKNARLFVPLLAQLEELILAGVTNGKQYKEMAKKLKMDAKSPELPEMIIRELSTN